VVMAVMVIGLGVLIWKVPPERWWVEIGAVATMGVILWFLGAWITRARKWGWIISLAGVSDFGLGYREPDAGGGGLDNFNKLN